MSVYLHGLAMRADLSANLKAVLAAFCDAAGEDDGTHCYPSLDYIRYKTGFSERHTRRLVRTLEAAHYIEPVAFLSGGRGHTTWYRIFIKRVPMKPDWSDVKKRLVEAGALAADDDIPHGAKPVGKRNEGTKGDILSPISKKTVKGDILSPISTVKGDILSPISTVKGDILSPKYSYRDKDSYTNEDSYGPISTDNKVSEEDAPAPLTAKMVEQENEPAAPDLPPPPPPNFAAPETPDVVAAWRRASLGMRNRGVSPSALATWIAPLRPLRGEWKGENFAVTLRAPGRDHVRMVEQRYHGLLVTALGAALLLPSQRISLRFEHSSALLEVNA